MSERRHRVSFTMDEIVDALKAHRPNCLHTQAIPTTGNSRATFGVVGPILDFVWTKLDHATAEKD